MAEEVDLKFLGEQIKRLQGDVRVLKSDMAQMRADNVKHESDLDAFSETVSDRFERLDKSLNDQAELIRSSFRTLMTEIQTLKKS